MKTGQLAKVAAVILVVAGVAALLASAAIALKSFTAPGFAVSPRQFDCGSVLSSKDPRSLTPRFQQVPLNLTLANKNCEKKRDDRTSKALIFMLVGAAPLLFVLALPAISRSSRRAKGRRRRR